MTDKPEAEQTSGEPQKASARKRWHAPQLIAMDLVETDTQMQAGSDGGPMNSHS
jgi:hypothetical protein